VAEIRKPAFPQTAEGVTDWEKVFEDPERGLIPLVGQAHSSDALRGCLMVVIQQLFTRTSDELEIARLTRQIEALFNEAGASVPAEAAVALLRQIKDHRIAKAREHIEKSKAAPRRRNRRNERFGDKVVRFLYILISRPRVLIGAIGALGIVAMVMLGAATGMFKIDLFLPESAPAGQVAGQAAPTDGKAGNALLPTPSYAEPRRADNPPTIVLRRMAVPRPFGDGRTNQPLILPVMVLTNPSAVSDVCQQMPVINHLMNLAFSDALQQKSDFSAGDLQAIGETVARQLNAKIGGRPAVAILHLVRTKDVSVNGPGRCGLASNAFHETLKTLIE